MQTRVQVAYHFQIDPAQLVPGAVRLPEQITRTVCVGDDFKTEKVSSDCLSAADRAGLLDAMEKQVREATRTARPAGAGPAALPEEPAEEMSAF